VAGISIDGAAPAAVKWGLVGPDPRAFLVFMLHRLRNRLATCLLAVVYLTAGAAGNLLHSHEHGSHAHDHTAGESCQHGHDHDNPGGNDQHNHAAPDATDGFALVAISSGHHDDCTICRAAGQRVVSAQSVQIVKLCGLVEPLPIVATHDTIAVAPRTQHSRAPPRAS
jgi:ABC-type Zn2+ transport system substrate-binding protein/surface adhesin